MASLGRRPPMSVATLAGAVGMDKGQISRALAGLVSRKLVSRAVNPATTGKCWSALPGPGWSPMRRLWQERWSATGICWNNSARTRRLLLLAHIDRLTDTAAKMLDAEKALN